METIASLRQEIDQVHKELYALLLRRRDLTMAVWKIKQEQGLPFYNAEREEQILADFVKLSADQGQDQQFDELLKGVMNSILREYERYLKSKYPKN
ncbi:chorismate mutase [Bdellovibrio svalbardensis]|uniref:chorismate mutase n=1 Tax=Bdellovibrio svalbardensis TaxID=2972972 RepID=A0ABT6DM76_9BACT|nr:chorismate mutase [Bdellovibrio svalbardensis]MDG0817704.1 chorismate mutase [Bdellovibrio svalbardensis]